MQPSGTSEVVLASAETFTREFFRLANQHVPPNGEARLATAWFEELMVTLAKGHGLYCQNKRSHSEWMNVDHVFIPQSNMYNDFPIIAVEHENRDLSASSKRGSLPDGNARDAFIEWAAWKALTIQARLHVLVAYPWQVDMTNVLSVLAQMVAGYAATFRTVPNALFLLGWWSRSLPTAWKAEQLYIPYVPVVGSDGAVTLTTLPLSST